LRPSPVTAVSLLLAIVAGACTQGRDVPPPGPAPSAAPGAPATSPAPAEPARFTVAFLESPDGEEAADRVAPAFQAARLAFSNATLVAGLPVIVDVVAYPVAGPDGAAEVAAQIATKPEVIAAIGAPGLTQQATLGDALDAAGVPWVSLSGSGAALADRGWTGWRRLIADQQAQGQVLATTADGVRTARRGVCLLGDGSDPSRSLLGAVAGSVRSEVVLRARVSEDPASVATAVVSVLERGCGVVVWAGVGSLGAALRRRLVEAGARRITFLGSDRIRDDGFLDAVGPAGEGVLASCPCVDVVTSTDLAAQRFIQDYQSEFGLPPGPYAVEAWDAARMLVDALRSGARTREEVRASLASVTAFEGLATVYRFGPGGDLADPAATVRLSAVEGGRWMELVPSIPR
jgi:ABC-type branched-subunit amino acid transport system substrate-binding protein